MIGRDRPIRRYAPATPYVYQPFPKWVDGPDGPVIVQNAEEARRVRFERARNIGRGKANAGQRLRADALCHRAGGAEIANLRASGCSLRDIADALNKRGIPSARGRQWGHRRYCVYSVGRKMLLQPVLQFQASRDRPFRKI